MPKIIAIVGMPGAGKTEAADFLVKKDFQFIRLGQLTLDEIKKRSLEPVEENERKIREDFRINYGMAAFAILNFPKIDEMIKKGDVVVDGLYSWEEYLAFKERYPSIKVVAIYASPKIRYKRLTKQTINKKDADIKRRHYTLEQAISRDKAQLENLHTGGPIAMADYTIINEYSKEDIKKCLQKIIEELE